MLARLVPGVALALVLVGCGTRVDRETGGGGSSSSSPEGPGAVLATVDGDPITEADVDRRLADVPPLSRPEFASPLGRDRLLDQLLEEEILWRAAHEEGVVDRPEVRREIERASRAIAVQAYLDVKQEELTRVSEEEARAFYERHQGEYFTEQNLIVRVFQHSDSMIVDRAREIVETGGGPMEQVCVRLCEDENLRGAAGLLPQRVRRDKAVPWLGNHPRFHEVVFDLEVGQLSERFETARGFMFARVEGGDDSRLRTFEEVQNDVVGRIRGQRTQQGLPELIAGLEERYEVTRLESERTAELLFTRAQATGNASEAVALYEELVERYPEHEHVADALFMIGFKKAEELGDEAGARVAFERLIADFGDSELAQSARWMLTSDSDTVPNLEGSAEEASP